METDNNSQSKIIGLLTEDSRLFFDLVRELKRRKLSFRSLNFNEKVPLDIGVILTSQNELAQMDFPVVVGVGVEDISRGIRKALQALSGMGSFPELVIGVDPGKEPGIAVLANGHVIELHRSRDSIECAKTIIEMLDSYCYEASRLKIGDGALESRNEILNKVAEAFSIVEIVDEFRTTKLTKDSHVDAAISIARSKKCLKRMMFIDQ